MALKNHALDGGILQAAREEFLENGYENSSLRKIAAAAGVTIGAIYTRYPTKDSLFCAVVQPLTDRFQTAFQEIRSSYYSREPDLQPERMMQSMQLESEAILHLLFDDYDRAVLLLCRSTGSSMEGFIDRVVEQKIRETQVYFQASGAGEPDQRVVKLLVGGQFHMYIQIIRSGYDLEAARDMMQAAVIYHTGGWLTLLNMHKNQIMEG